jgi:hypothetical protein
LLHRDPHDFRVLNFQSAHGRLLSDPIVPEKDDMRNYLRRYV